MFPQDLWPPYLVGWRVKLKDLLQQTPVTPSSSGQLITRQIKNVVFSLPRGLLLLNLTRSYFLMKICYPQSHITRCSRGTSGHMTNRKHYISIFTGSVATKLTGIRWGATNLRVKCPFVHVVTWGNVTNKKRYIWTSAKLHLLNLKWWCLMSRGHHPQWSHDTIVAWRIKVVISLFLHGSCLQNSTRWYSLLYWATISKSHDSLITWVYVVSWQIKKLYLQFHKSYGHQAWQGRGLWHGANTQ